MDEAMGPWYKSIIHMLSTISILQNSLMYFEFATHFKNIKNIYQSRKCIYGRISNLNYHSVLG